MRALLAVVILLLAGCSTIPDELTVAEGQSLAAYSSARQGLEQGKLARWGGVIAKVDNLADSTRLEVVYYPLSSSARPQSDETSPGRFLAYLDGFVDPMILEAGRSITLVGPMRGLESGQVGEFQYQYPTLKVQRFKLWKERVARDVYYMDPWYSPWYGPWPYWRSPYYYGRYYGHRHFAHDPFFAPTRSRSGGKSSPRKEEKKP